MELYCQPKRPRPGAITSGRALTGGTFKIDGASSNAGTVKVEGAATLSLAGALTNTGLVSAAAAGAVIDLVGGSLSGGQVNVALGATVEATGGPSSPSTIGGGAQVTDRGLLEATGNTTLTLANTTINATVSKTGGVITGGIIEAVDSGATPATIVLDGATINGGALETATDGVIEIAAGTTSTFFGVTVTAGTTVNVVDGSTLVLQGTNAVAGNIAVGTALGATLEIATPDAKLTGNGTVTLSDSSGNVIAAAPAGAALTNQDTILGAGAIGHDDGKLTLVNKGTIDATGTANQLVIDTANAVTNAGLMEATGAAGLLLRKSTVANTGTIEGQNGSHVDLQSVTITGGTLATAGTGVIKTTDSASILDGRAKTVTNKGVVKVTDGTSLTLKGTISNPGTIDVDLPGGATGAALDISGAVTLAGAGAVVLADGTASSLVAAPGGGVLTNAGNTISGAGTIGADDGALTLINEKTVAATGTHALTIHTGALVTNSGSLEALGGSKLIIDDAVSNSRAIASLGASSDVVIASAVTNTATNATVLAGASGATVELAGGGISGGRVTIVTGATIDADGGASSPSTIDGARVTDAGTLEATNHTTLTLSNSTVNATGGVIEAVDGIVADAGPSTIALAGAVIEAGTLETTLDGVITTVTATTNALYGVTIAAGTTVDVVDNSTLALKGTITNNGTIALNSTGDATTLAIGGSVTLTGGGRVTLADIPPAVLGGTAADIAASGASSLKPFTLTNVDNIIDAAGAIGNSGDATLKLINGAGATIDATGTHALVVDTGNTIDNFGLLEATAPGGLVIDDAVANFGTIAADGGKVTIGGNLTGSGKAEVAEIFSGNQMELKGTLNNAAMSFQNNAGDTGRLILDHASPSGAQTGFKGTVVGFLSDGTNSDTLDVQDINFAGVSWSFKENKAGTQGVLTLTDASHTANITLIGQYLAASQSASSAGPTPSLFQTAQDATGGTLVTTTFKPAAI